jgi:branched-chain amino acid transport system substrate-binding protein
MSYKWRMSRTLSIACGLAALTALAAAGASARTAATSGLTATSITLGGTFPLSGEASAAASIPRAARAYFRYVNANGGIYGRRIDFRFRDDRFDPARAVAATQRLVSKDRAFAIFGSYGTEENLATRPLLNRLGVPQLLVSSSATTLGRDTARYPFTIGFPPSSVIEGRLLAHELLRNEPSARIGVLYENDDYGTDLLRSLRRGLGARASAIVSAQPFDPAAPDIRAQMLALKASKATTFVCFASGKRVIEAYVFAAQLGWRPRTYLNAAAGTASVMKVAAASVGRALTDGTVSLSFVKDPASPGIVADKGYLLFKSVLDEYDPGVRTDDVNAMYGMAAAYTMVDVLRLAGRSPTRKGLVRAAARLSEQSNPFLLPGVVVKTSPTDHFPLAQAKLVRWQSGHWIPYGKLLSG